MIRDFPLGLGWAVDAVDRQIESEYGQRRGLKMTDYPHKIVGLHKSHK